MKANAGRGKLQRAILAMLADGPVAHAEVVAAVTKATRTTEANASRSVEVLCQLGLVVAEEQGLLYRVETPSPVETAPVPYQSTRFLSAYRALASAGGLLLQGDPVPMGALFPATKSLQPFFRFVLARMSEQGLVQEMGGLYSMSDKRAFKRAWGNEREWCLLAGWSITLEHSTSMDSLLRGAPLSTQAAAAVAACGLIGQNNVLRRTNMPHAELLALRQMHTLPAEVQRDLDERGGTALEAMADVADDVEESEGEGDDVDDIDSDAAVEAGHPDDLDLGSLVAMCLKLSAATAEMVRSMDRKLDWLAAELGYKEDP